MRISRVPATFVIAIAVFDVVLIGQPSHAEPASKAAEKLDVPKPVEPSAATSTIVVPAGFRVELVAAEPLVRDPMAMEFDENGFAYVLEIPRYNEHGKPGPTNALAASPGWKIPTATADLIAARRSPTI